MKIAIGIFLILTVIAVGVFLLYPSSVVAENQTVETIQLPAPQTQGGMPLMEALEKRHTTRDFSDQKLSDQVLSNLLWAAFGVNRKDSGKRTAPSARNWQEISIYVAKEDGLFLYDAAANALKQISSADIRAKTGTQDFVGNAPVNLVYVADLAKISAGDEDQKKFYAAADTGFIAQNVYLFAASEGLGTVVRGSVDRNALEKAMKLGPRQEITLAQTVGYPKKD